MAALILFYFVFFLFFSLSTLTKDGKWTCLHYITFYFIFLFFDIVRYNILTFVVF